MIHKVVNQKAKESQERSKNGWNVGHESKRCYLCLYHVVGIYGKGKIIRGSCN